MTTPSSRGRLALSHAKASYAYALIGLTLVVALASFIRDRGELLSNISLWLFIATLAATLASERLGLITVIALLALSPSLHQQANALTGTTMHAWAFPGVDCAVGYVGGWVLKRGFKGLDAALERFPAGPLLLLHAWIGISAIAAVCRNLWQSASYTSLRGIAYNAWLVRGISWHDDFYPIQDLFFYSVVIALLFCVWDTVICHGRRMVAEMAAILLTAASANAAFAAWQRWSGKGWAAGDLGVEVNAFWPDLHSFGALMAVAFILCGGILSSRTVSRSTRTLVFLAMFASALGLLLSGSRSTLLIVCAVLVGVAVWSAFRTRGRRRLVSLLVAVLPLAVLHLVLLRGYRGVSYESLHSVISSIDVQALNAALSHRPEIWTAAIGMYFASPLFGLGQGAFYRLSAIPEFSKAQALTELGGSGAHNYFLQSFVELGPIGLLIALFISLPFLRLGTRNLRLVSAYVLLGIAVGNLYAHSMLVREMLMLAAIFVGSYIWEAETGEASNLRVPGPTATLHTALALVVLLVLAIADYATSFSRFPFTYGERCFKSQGLERDGWTSGTLRVQLPHEVTKVTMTVLADRPDLSLSALDLEVAVIEGHTRVLRTDHYRFDLGGALSRSIEVPVPSSPVDWRYLELRSSRCYVPLNLGITYDPRRLGVRVTELHSYTSTGVEVTPRR